MPARSVISKPAFHDCYGCDTEIFILDTLERSFFLSFGCAGEEACGMIKKKKKKRGKTEKEREGGSHLVHRNHKAQADCRDSSVHASDVGGVGRGTHA